MDEIYVVMPVYNAAKYLKHSIRSVQDQSFSQFRLILVDDGSTDASGRICDDFARKDPRITVIHQQNQGSFLARKNGVLQCPDDGFVTFLDADDALLPDALQQLRDAMQESGADIAVGSMVRMWRGRLFRFQPDDTTESDIDRALFFQKYFCSWYGITALSVSLWAKLFKSGLLKEAYTQIPEDLTHFFGDDLLVTLHYYVRCDHIRILGNSKVYAYRVGGGSGKYNPNMMREFFSLYTYKLDFAKAYSVPQDLRLLSDIELCYITASYAKQLFAAPHFTAEDRQENLRALMQEPILRTAAQNVLQSDFRDKQNAQWIDAGDAESMLRAAEPSLRDKAKRIFYRFS